METATTSKEKPKVDVKAIMARASEKTKAVKASTEKVEAKTKSFRIVPGFSKYEFNGVILRNESTKSIIKFKTGRTKYQINDDEGKSHNLSNDDLKGLMPVEKTKATKEPKAPREKKEKVVKEKKEKSPPANLEEEKAKVADVSKKEIMAQDGPKHKKIYMLHLKGCGVEEINEMIKSPIPSIKRDIWRYQQGKTVL